MQLICFRCLPLFCASKEKDREMKMIHFNSLEEAIECYGRDKLIAIDNLRQIIYYCSNGCQPRFIWENEKRPNKITAWFLKDETNYVFRKWMETKPT